MGNVIAEVLTTAKEQLDETINKAKTTSDEMGDIIQRIEDSDVITEVHNARGNTSNLQERLDNSDLALNYTNSILEGKRDKSVRINSNDVENLNINNFDEYTRGLLQGLSEGEINAVLGDKNVKTINIDDGAVTSLNTYLFEGNLLKDSITIDYKNMKIKIKANSYIFADWKTYNITTSDIEIDLPTTINNRAHLLLYDRVNNTIKLISNNQLPTIYDILICYIYKENIYGKNASCINVVKNIEDLHNVDYIVNNILNNPFRNVKVKFVGDSITAGVGSTGYGLTDIPIGTTGKFVPLQDSSCWANKLARRIEELYSNNTFILPSQITDSATSVFSSDKLSLLREQKYYIPTVGSKCFDYSFKGDSINIYFSKQAGSGIVGVYIDDNKIGDVDLYSSTTEYSFKYEINGLENGEHILSIKCTGKNASSSSRRIYIEALEIPKKVTCVNYGISGINTESVVNWLDQLIETDDDVIIMQIGTNDRAFNDVSITLKNLRTIINYIKSKRKELILFCSSPTSKTDDEKSSHKLKMQRILTCISKVAEENNIRFVNQYNYLSMYCKEKNIDINSLLKDGLHPNDTGYELMYHNACKELNIAIE